jgi:hypothetical protein
MGMAPPSTRPMSIPQAERSAAAEFERYAGRRMNITEDQRDKGWLLARASLGAALSDRSPPEVERGFVESFSMTELSCPFREPQLR